jgi:hypothetical protein
MALFFDQDWFNAKLELSSKTKANLAQTLGLELEGVNEIWKDQRELSINDVVLIAGFLSVGVEEVADHAGVSTPNPSDQTVGRAELIAENRKVIDDLDQAKDQIKELEDQLARLKTRT